MMIQYFTVDGRCIITKSNVNARYIELPDGYHPISNDSVWQDDKRMRQPILSIFEGVTPPLGADMSEEDLKNLMREIELIKLGFKKPSVSKMWMRLLAQIGQVIWKYGAMAFIAVFIGYFLVQAMIGGL